MEKSYKEYEGKVIAKAWKDPAFKKKLLSDPKAAFKEVGFDFPESVKVTAVENTPTAFTFVLPLSKEGIKHLKDAELGKMSGGEFSFDEVHEMCR